MLPAILIALIATAVIAIGVRLASLGTKPEKDSGSYLPGDDQTLSATGKCEQNHTIALA